jgi:TetR/AcrR family transcriptional repressor of nem operon
MEVPNPVRTRQSYAWLPIGRLSAENSQMLPFIPGRRTVDQERVFFAIFSTMIGAVEMARTLLDPAREKMLASTRDFLLRSFGPPQS